MLSPAGVATTPQLLGGFTEAPTGRGGRPGVRPGTGLWSRRRPGEALWGRTAAFCSHAALTIMPEDGAAHISVMKTIRYPMNLFEHRAK